MIILDTNIVSEVWRPAPDSAVADWVRSRPAGSIYLCAPVLAELRYGVERLAPGRRKDALKATIDHYETEVYRDRILPLDTAAATEFGRLMVTRERAGRRMSTMDGLIAAIAVVHGAALATRDIRDFVDLGLRVINPFDARPSL